MRLVGARDAQPFYIGLAKNFRDPSVFRANQVYFLTGDTVVNGRKSTVYRSGSDVVGSVAMPLDVGSAIAKYLNNRPDSAGAVPCPQAEALAKLIEPLLPPA